MASEATEMLNARVKDMKEHFPVLSRLEIILKASLTKEEISQLAEFSDSVAFGFLDFITRLNSEINPTDYLNGEPR